MFKEIKKDIATILTDSGTRKRTTLNRLDKSVFEDIEITAMALHGKVSELEKQLKKEQKENEQKNMHAGYIEQPQQDSTKAAATKPKVKRTTSKKRLSADKPPSRKQK